MCECIVRSEKVKLEKEDEIKTKAKILRCRILSPKGLPKIHTKEEATNGNKTI